MNRKNRSHDGGCSSNQAARPTRWALSSAAARNHFANCRLLRIANRQLPSPLDLDPRGNVHTAKLLVDRHPLVRAVITLSIAAAETVISVDESDTLCWRDEEQVRGQIQPRNGRAVRGLHERATSGIKPRLCIRPVRAVGQRYALCQVSPFTGGGVRRLSPSHFT